MVYDRDVPFSYIWPCFVLVLVPLQMKECAPCAGMPPTPRVMLSINPLWPHYLSAAAIHLALVAGLLRVIFWVSARSVQWVLPLSWPFRMISDPFHCDVLLNEGEWLDRDFKNWQPEGDNECSCVTISTYMRLHLAGCMTHKYSPKDIGQCLHNRQVVFIGDSVTRQLYFGLAHLADPNSPFHSEMVNGPLRLPLGSIQDSMEVF